MDDFEDDLTIPVHTSAKSDAFDDDHTVAMNRPFRKVGDTKPSATKTERPDDPRNSDALSQRAARTIGKVATPVPLKANPGGGPVWVPPPRPNAPSGSAALPQRKRALIVPWSVVAIVAVVVVFFIVFQLVSG